MTHDPDPPTTGTEDVEDVVSVVCGHTWFEVRLDRHVFAFHIPGTRSRFTVHHTNPARYRLGRTSRLTPTPRCDHRPTCSSTRPPTRPTTHTLPHYAMENPMTFDPTPTPLDLTRYLEQLAESAGYQVDWSELDPACADHPDLVTGWVSAAACHAGLAHARRLLASPAAFLRERVGAGDFDDTTGCEVAMLFGLHEHDAHLETLLANATTDFASCCKRLAQSGTGLTWPADQPVDPPTGPPADTFADLSAGPPQDTPVDPVDDAAGDDALRRLPMPRHAWTAPSAFPPALTTGR